MQSLKDPLEVDLMIESSSGGSMKHVMDLYSGLKLRGHDVRLLVSLRRADPEVISWVKDLDAKNTIILDLNRSPGIDDVFKIIKIRNTLKAEGGKRIMHAHSTKASIITSYLKDVTKATICTPHAYRGMGENINKPARLLITRCEKIFSKKMNAVIAVSPDEFEYAKSLGVEEKRVRYIPNGIDINSVINKSSYGKNQYSSKSPVIGFVGRFVPQKNPGLFLKTIHKVKEVIPNINAVMIGGGELNSEIQNEIKRLSLEANVKILGPISFVDNMNCMDIMVHTSLYESLPYVLLEAASVGMPIISVKNSGSEAIWPTKKLHAMDELSLANDIISAISCPDRFMELSVESSDSAKNFSISTMIDKNEELYYEFSKK